MAKKSHVGAQRKKRNSHNVGGKRLVLQVYQRIVERAESIVYFK